MYICYASTVLTQMCLLKLFVNYSKTDLDASVVNTIRGAK